jgi:hypothetical protein
MGSGIMSDEARLQERMRQYVADEPPPGLTFETVVSLGRRNRRRRLTAASGLAALAIVAGGTAVYAVGADPDGAADRHPPSAEEPDPEPTHRADPTSIRAALTQGVRDRLDAGTAEPGRITNYGRHLGGQHPADAIQIQVEINGPDPGRLTGVVTRGDARPGGSRDCRSYEWGGTVCRSVQVDDGVVLVTRDTDYRLDDRPGLEDMEVILIRDDWTGARITQYNFDRDDPQDAASDFPLTTAEAVSLVQDPALDYR